MKNKTFLSALMFFLMIGFQAKAQNSQTSELGIDELNTITTAVPFLIIAPDARSGSMGDAGVASTPDVYSMHWNPAKYAFAEKNMGVGVSYSPWLRQLVNDINLAYLTGYKKIDNMQTIAASLLYFSLGNITFTDNNGVETGTYKPNEFAVDACYSRKLSENLSGGLAMRYIYSNLTGGQYVGSQSTHAGNTVAADVSFFYTKKFESKKKMNNNLKVGLNISNIGAKISYTESVERDFIPTNLRLGTCYTMELDQYNTLSMMVDFNKLLVPTPPTYKLDSTGNPIKENGEYVIDKGYPPDVSIVSGMFQSFYDAPGGFKEEMREYNISLGAEYWYDKQFALRAGYFNESQTKGNRRYFTLGAGLRYSVFGIDFAYLIPASRDVKSPLSNTLRFSLTFDFDAFKEQNKK